MLAPLPLHLTDRPPLYRASESDVSPGHGQVTGRRPSNDRRSSFMINDILADRILPVIANPGGENRSAAAAAAIFATNCFRSAVEASLSSQSFNRTGGKMDTSRDGDILVDDYRRFPSAGNAVVISGRDDVSSSWVMAPSAGLSSSGNDLSCKATYCDSDVDIDDDNDGDSGSSIAG
jgi:hypothetical protein